MSGGGIPIRFRRTTSDVPIDTIKVGGALWHMLDRKLGIWNGDFMCWYPGIDAVKKLFVLNQDQRMAGLDANGDTNNIAISFNEPGKMQIIDTSTSEVLFSIDQTGVVMPNPIVEEVLPGGSLQRTSHPGFMPQFFPAEAVNSDDDIGFVGPNTYLWKKAGGAGRAEVRYAYKAGGGQLTHSTAEAYTLEFKAASALNNIGLRSWFFDPSLAYDGSINKNKIFVSLWSPIGYSNVIRVGRAGVYATTTIIGTNTWQRVALNLPTHDISESYAYNPDFEPYAIDWFYNTTGGTWYLSEPTVQCVDVVTTEIYQFRSIAERMAVADAYFWQPPTQFFEGVDKKSFDLPTSLPALHSKADYDIAMISSEHNVATFEKTQRGFTLFTDEPAITGQWNAKFKVGYRGPLTDIV